MQRAPSHCYTCTGIPATDQNLHSTLHCSSETESLSCLEKIAKMRADTPLMFASHLGVLLHMNSQSDRYMYVSVCLLALKMHLSKSLELKNNHYIITLNN